MPTPVILDAVRTPVGRAGGVLAGVRPDDLAALVIRRLLERNPVEPAAVGEVYCGCANQAGEDNRNVARMAALLAGLPHEVPATTVNKLCASGLEAVNQAARAVSLSEGELYIAGGVESMSRAPLVMPNGASAWQRGNRVAYDTAIGWRFPNPKMEALFPLESMGETAENLVARHGIDRERQDRFAVRSHERAVAAMRSNAFADEIVEVSIRDRRGNETLVREDEGPRADTTLEKLARLKPVFRPGGTVTAGNSSSLNDGASALLIASAQKAAELGRKPLARILGWTSAGVDPRFMGLGPVPAVRKLLARTGLGIGDFDLIELNEAFAVQVLAVVDELGMDAERVNIHGGAIALGHPLGCTGARILTTLVHAMKARGARRGLATLCVGVGQGVAMAVEAVS